MRPVLFELNLGGRPIDIGSYRFFVILAIVAGAAVIWTALRRSDVGRGRAGVFVLATAAAFPVGARLLFLVTHPPREATVSARLVDLTPGQFSLYGGLLASALTGLLLAKLLGMSWSRTADAAIPGLGVSVFLAKTGCLLDGCCPGAVSALPWAVTLPGVTAEPPAGLPGALRGLVVQTLANPTPTHPIAAYEMLSVVVAALVAMRFARGRSAGTAFFIFVALFSGARWLIFYLRTSQSELDLAVYPLIYPVIIIVSGVMLYRLHLGSRAVPEEKSFEECCRCPLCAGSGPFKQLIGPRDFSYRLCPACRLIFMDRQFLPAPDAKEERYRTHQNGPQYPGYVSFLNRAVVPARPYLQTGMRGLDYGCGPAPTLSRMLEKDGLRCENYDPFFYPTYPEGRFDFIFATEAVEHFFEPGEELARITDLLAPGGILIITTEPWTAPEDFPDWYYAKDPTHVCFYHENTWEYFCAEYGFHLLNRQNPRVSVMKKQAPA